MDMVSLAAFNRRFVIDLLDRCVGICNDLRVEESNILSKEFILGNNQPNHVVIVAGIDTYKVGIRKKTKIKICLC